MGYVLRIYWNWWITNWVEECIQVLMIIEFVKIMAEWDLRLEVDSCTRLHSRNRNFIKIYLTWLLLSSNVLSNLMCGCFTISLQVPLSDDYDDRQSYVQTPPRGRGSSEIIDNNRSNFNIPSQSNSNKSNREKLIDKLKVRPITTTPEPITTTRRASVREQEAKRTKYTPITR